MKRKQFDGGGSPEISSQRTDVWSEEEHKALMEFVPFHCSDAWPTFVKSHKFWKQAAEFVFKRAKAKRTATSKCINVPLSTNCTGTV
jgi:hypothetical protein